MNELVWKRWHPMDYSLQVALETTLLAGTAAEYVDGVETPMVDLEKEKMIYRTREQEAESKLGSILAAAMGSEVSNKETKDRHYHPRVGFAANLQSATRRVSFKVHLKNELRGSESYRRLHLRRHTSGGRTPARMWCGRAGEKEAFGFNTEGSKSEVYLPLAYPGKSGRFEPLFIKVMDPGMNAPYYLKVEAHDEADGVVAVEASLVSVLKVPAFLRV